MSRSSCALYLSLRYHQLNPNYIYDRLKSTKFPYELKILLVQCDVNEPSQSLKELARLSMIYELTLLVSWSDEESAKYLETYRIMEGKSAETLLDGQQNQSNDYLTKYIETITQVFNDFSFILNDFFYFKIKSKIKSINKTDGQTLLHAFGSFDSIIKSSIEQLSICPGLGKLKAQRLYQTFNQSFSRQSFSNKFNSTKYFPNQFNNKLLNSSIDDQDQDD